MAIRIGSSNISSLTAQRSLSDATSKAADAYKQLSSGLRINGASDDPAGLAIAAGLESTARVFAVGVRNVNDGISANNIAQGGLNALQQISERQLELAQQAANGTLSTTQRTALNTEANALVDEYNRIVSTTTFNGMNLFDPNLGTVFIAAGNGTIGENFNSSLVHFVGDGTFQASKSLASGGTGDENVILADVNGDGVLDILTGDVLSGDVSVVISNGNGTFQAAKTVHTTGNPKTIRAADINGDGNLDLVAADYNTGDVSVLLGNGNGTFQGAKSYQTGGTQPKDFQFGDINGDGKLDLIVGNYTSNNVGILISNGDGTFQAAKTYQIGQLVRSISVGDINGDGHLDIVTVNPFTNTFSVLVANSDGTFKPRTSYATGSSPKAVALSDVNGDGILDLLTGDYGAGDISIHLGNGNGTFQGATTIQTGGTQPRSIQFADTNGDGVLDIVTTDTGGNDVSIFISNGDGTYKGVTSYHVSGSQPKTVAVGDVTGDGVLDIVTADYSSNDISVLVGNGSKTANSTYLNLTTQSAALLSESTISANITRIQKQLGSLGAADSVFQVVVSNLQAQTQNFEDAASKIEDVDVAETTAKLLRAEILQQAASAILAQANQEPALVLKLLGK